MKKISLLLALFLALTFLMSGCKPKEYEPVFSKEYSCFHFPGTDWGMSEEELFKALGKTADDFETETDNSSAYAKLKTLKSENEFLKKECQTSFVFSAVPSGDIYRLRSVSLNYDLGEKSFDGFKSELEELIESQGAEYSVSEIEKMSSDGAEVAQKFSIKAKKLTDDLPKEMLDNADSYNRYIIENDIIDFKGLGYSDDEIAKEKERRLKVDISKVLSGEICEVSVINFYENNTCLVTFSAERLVTINSFSEEYLKS